MNAGVHRREGMNILHLLPNHGQSRVKVGKSARGKRGTACHKLYKCLQQGNDTFVQSQLEQTCIATYNIHKSRLSCTNRLFG